jgi:hypothetical protein
MKIPSKFNGAIDYRRQDYVYEMRRSLRRLIRQRGVTPSGRPARSLPW